MQNYLQLKKSSGMTQIELLVGISIISIIGMALFSLLFVNNNLLNSIENSNDEIINRYYGIEYLRNEISNSDLIIPSKYFKNSTTMKPLAFVIQKEVYSYRRNSNNKERYNKVIYCVKGDKLIRNSCKSNEFKFENLKIFSGYSEILTGVEKVNSSIDYESSQIKIKIEFTNGDFATINMKLRCELYEKSI
ncbi:MAG: hypothetical protein GXZ08_07630 [Tissierellia bacterium]|nr:hypothetical protein [Tissierellia bacterium]